MRGQAIWVPYGANHRLGYDTCTLFDAPERYRQLVYCLILLVVTRPNIVYSVHILSQFLQVLRVAHWEAAIRVVKYLKGTLSHGILLRANCDLTV